MKNYRNSSNSGVVQQLKQRSQTEITSQEYQAYIEASKQFSGLQPQLPEAAIKALAAEVVRRLRFKLSRSAHGAPDSAENPEPDASLELLAAEADDRASALSTGETALAMVQKFQSDVERCDLVGSFLELATKQDANFVESFVQDTNIEMVTRRLSAFIESDD